MADLNLRDLLHSDTPGDYLREMVQDGSLKNLEPTLSGLRLKIPEGYSHKDNLNHSIKVLENSIGLETKKDTVLRVAALFHDVGKPATRKFHSNGVVSFTNHEIVGARMVKKILPLHGFEVPVVNRVSKLVSLHMRAYGFVEGKWSSSAVRRLITDAEDQETVEQLLALFHADITTGNPAKSRTIHTNLNKLETQVKEVRLADARAALRPALDGNKVMGLFGLTPGPQLGAVMKYLNTDEGVRLTENEAVNEIKNRFGLTLI